MGLRRLRARLDHMEGDGDWTMAMVRDLVADLKDGFGVKIEFDGAKAADLLERLVTAQVKDGKFELPITIRVIPEEDA